MNVFRLIQCMMWPVHLRLTISGYYLCFTKKKKSDVTFRKGVIVNNYDKKAIIKHMEWHRKQTDQRSAFQKDFLLYFLINPQEKASFIYKTVELFVQSECRNLRAGQIQKTCVVLKDGRPLSSSLYTDEDTILHHLTPETLLNQSQTSNSFSAIFVFWLISIMSGTSI